jgi:hypothetical protein
VNRIGAAGAVGDRDGQEVRTDGMGRRRDGSRGRGGQGEGGESAKNAHGEYTSFRS